MELSLLILILLLAAALRLWQLDGVPPGFTHDEAAHGLDAVAILRGARPIYQTVGYGREPLYDYYVAGLMGLFGPTGNTLRLSVVPLGLTTLLLTFAWVRLAFDSPTALVAVALQAASFWSLATSRQALRSGLLPVLFTAAVYLFWRAVFASPDRPRRWQVVLFALLIGATVYTYIPARLIWIVFPAFMAYLMLFHRGALRRTWRPTVVGVLLGLLLAVPLFAYLRTHPGAEQRLDMLEAPLRELYEGDPSGVISQTQRALAGFLLPSQGDDFLAYGIPGRPIFDLPTGVLLLAGLGLCLVRWREPAYAFSLIWFVAGISPSLVTGATASTTRSIAALPVVFLFPALAVVAGIRGARTRWGERTGKALWAGFIVLVAVTGANAAYNYFVTWGNSADVRAAYQHTVIETARTLDLQEPGGVVALSTLHPSAPHDPYVFEMGLRRRDLSLRWFDGRLALILPSDPQARLVAPHSASLDAYFANLAGFRLRQRVSLRADDLDPFIEIYDWEPPITLAALREQADGRPLDLSLPVNFGDALQLLGYDLSTPTVAPGGNVELVTLWQVTDPQAARQGDTSGTETELVFFTHALDAASAVVGQRDRLDAPAWGWQAGDVIAQIHRFPLQADLPPGPITLEVGIYRRTDLARLPILKDGSVIGDRVLLQALEVRGP
jgi:4-amino-4-deoxy-L-arabinose transferase-like glycosyltransferase